METTPQKLKRLLPYVSFSRLKSFEEGRYEKQYILGQPFFETKEMKFGKMFAEALEGKETEREDINNFAKVINLILPKGGHEVELDSTIVYNGEIIKLYGFADYFKTANETPSFIFEFKTGKKEWNQSRADNHGQVHLYQYIMFTLGYKLDGEYWWFETREENGVIYFTGRIEKFIIPFEEKNMELIKERVIRFLDWLSVYEEPKVLKL